MARYAAGIDLGGTKILTGIFEASRGLIARVKLPTCPEDGPERVVERMTGSLLQLCNEHNLEIRELEGLATGSPGVIDSERRTVYNAPNLGWKEFPLGKKLEEKLGIPVWIDNDANLAALAEYQYGYQKKYAVLIYLTASTGVGGGIIIDGQIYRGFRGGAGEFGHMTLFPNGIKCKCGNVGCLETVASGTAVAREAKALVEAGRGKAILNLAGGRLDNIDARLVAQAALDGDQEARELLNKAFDYLGIGIASLVNVFDPQAVVLGGGLASIKELWLDRIWQQVRARAFAHLLEGLEILPSALGSLSGLMGCRALLETKLGFLEGATGEILKGRGDS